MVLDDIRKTFEAVIEQLTPARAQELATRYLEPNAARDQVSRTANELLRLSRRARGSVRAEVASQMRSMGLATRAEVEALRKRVRDLERAVGASGGSGRTRAAAAKTSTASRARSSRATARSTTTARSTAVRTSTPRSRGRKPPAS
jgi:polyhydroxyalkanoate synthesis regulator phasin